MLAHPATPPHELLATAVATPGLFTPAGPILGPQIGRMLETHRDTPIEEIRKRFARDGYILVKGLIDKEVITEARRTYFNSLKEVGILDPSKPSEEGVFVGGKSAIDTFVTPGSVRGAEADFDAEKSRAWMDAILENQRSEWLNKFSTNSQLTEFVKELMDWDKLLLVKRQMLRNALPGSDHVPVHYDQLYFRQGPPTFITCWTPFDDTAPNRGGLMYLSDSSKLGEGLENDFNERAQGMTREQRESAFNANMMQGGIIHPDADVFAAGHGRQWLMTDYQIGDVAFHNPFIIHASCVNSDPSNRIMVHTDIRFVHPEQPYDQRWHEYWAPADGL